MQVYDNIKFVDKFMKFLRKYYYILGFGNSAAQIGQPYDDQAHFDQQNLIWKSQY